MPQRVSELQNIQPISNIPSVLANGGILSYERAAALRHASVAMQEVQDRRDRKQVPGGRLLHHYANLYFCARNPMMYSRRHLKNQLCVLQIDRRILTQQGVVIADRNAASGYVRFLRSPDGLHHLELDMIYADSWTHPGNEIEYYKHKSIKCAEVLVPDAVPNDRIIGAYVANRTAEQLLLEHGFNKPITVNAHMFF